MSILMLRRAGRPGGLSSAGAGGTRAAGGVQAMGGTQAAGGAGVAEPLSPRQLAALDAYLGLHAGKENMLIPALQHAQVLFGYLPAEVLGEIGTRLRVPAARVYGVATFYAQFRLHPSGEHTVKVCTGTACHVRGAGSILLAMSQTLGIGPGETTGDRRFTLERVACLGTCGLAPAVMLDGATHGRLAPGKVKQVLASIPKGEKAEADGT